MAAHAARAAAQAVTIFFAFMPGLLRSHATGRAEPVATHRGYAAPVMTGVKRATVSTVSSKTAIPSRTAPH